MTRALTRLSRSRLARPARERAGRWLHARIEAAVADRVRYELEADRAARLSTVSVWGPRERLKIAPTAVLNDALLNTVSGTIVIEEHAFFGHGVALLTGTHDVTRLEEARQLAVPSAGRDIVVGRGAWIASRAIVLGPCRVGENAVVSAGAVVRKDVPPGAIVAGNPADAIGAIAPARN